MDDMSMGYPVVTDPHGDLNPNSWGSGSRKDEQEITKEEEKKQEPYQITDEENPLNEMSERQIKNIMQQCMNMLRVLEAEWNASKKEFKLTDTHMKELYQYNSQHAVPMPEDLTEAERDNWDYFNGLNEIPEEEVIRIFGEGHPIIGVEHTVTVDRIKYIITDFFEYTRVLNEYTKIHNAYIELIELKEAKEIESLKVIRNKEEDPEKKALLQSVIDNYYYRKNLDFLAEPLDEKFIEKIVSAYNDAKKIEYWMQRCRDKLSQLKISQKFIVEISQFEKRYLPEEYHKLSNILLLYFMNITTFCDVGNKNDKNRTNVVSIVMAMDSLIRNTMSDDQKEIVMNNIKKLLDQFMDKIN